MKRVPSLRTGIRFLCLTILISTLLTNKAFSDRKEIGRSKEIIYIEDFSSSQYLDTQDQQNNLAFLQKGKASFYSQDLTSKYAALYTQLILVKGKLYFGATTKGFYMYDPATGKTTDLTLKVPFITSYGIAVISRFIYVPEKNEIYLFGVNKEFGKYNITKQIGYDLSYKLSSIPDGNLQCGAYIKSDKSLFIATSAGYLIKFNIDNEKVEWVMHVSNNPIYAITYDADSKEIFLSGGGFFGKVNLKNNIFTNLTYVANGLMTALTYDSFSKQIYMGGGSFLAVYNPVNNTILGLGNEIGSAAPIGDASYISTVVNLIYNPENKFIYIGADHSFTYYNPFTDKINVLEDGAVHISTALDSKTNTIYYSAVNLTMGTSSIGKFSIVNNSFTDLSPSINKALGHNNFGGEQGINKFCYDDKNDTIYFADDRSDFISNASGGTPYLAQYKLQDVTATSLVGLFNGVTPQISSLLCISSQQKIYLGTQNGGFFVYDTLLNNLSDLTNRISSFWGTNPINAMTFIPQTGEIFLGGGNQRFAKYNIYNELPTDLTSIISPYFGDSNYVIASLVYVPNTNDLYIGGGEKSIIPCIGFLCQITASYHLRFINYNITNNGVVDLSSNVYDALNQGFINNIVYNSVTQKLYITANQYGNCNNLFKTCSDINGKIIEYNLLNSVPNDLTPLLADRNFGDAIKSIAVNNTTGALYVGSDGESLALIDPTKDTVQDLSYYMPPDYQDEYWGKLPITALLYISETDSLFIGGDLRKFIQYKDHAFIVSRTINSQHKDIKEATVDYTDNGNIEYYLSNNGGGTWNKVSQNEKLIFPKEGKDLRWKIFIKDKDSYTSSITIRYKYSY